MQALLKWMEGSSLAKLIHDVTWIFPTLETLHFLGLILLAGSLLVIDLRCLGAVRACPVRAVLPLLKWSLLGFGINLVTGILFVFSDPFHYYANIAFRLKIAAILLAGMNALAFGLAARPHIFARDGSAGMPPAVQCMAALSLAFWFAVIVLGRLIPYV